MRRARAAGLAAGLSLLAAAPAQAADTSYSPVNNDFRSGAQGWSGSDTGCSPITGVGALCSASTEHSGAAGNPPGSIALRTDVTVNALSLFRARGRWTSPEFGIPTGSTPREAFFAYDRRLERGGLLSVAPVSRPQVSLVDLTANRTTPVLEELLGPGNGAFGRRAQGVPASALVPGHRYRLRIDTTTTTTLLGAGVLGTTNARFDNVGLSVAAIPSGGAEVSPGVTIVRGPVTINELNVTLKGLNWSADFGTGPGGSIVPLSRCTIVGTPGNDVIRGTTGNDVICGLGGNDRINGSRGRDIIDGADGNDRLNGGSGNDTVAALRGRDNVDGSSGNDRVGGGASNDRVSGSSGNDRVRGGGGNDLVRGRSGNDSIEGNRGNDRLYGDSGRDRLFGQTGNDRFFAKDRRRDRVDGGSGRDTARVDRRGGRRRDVLRAIDRAR